MTGYQQKRDEAARFLLSPLPGGFSKAQSEEEAAALARFTLQPDLSAMQFDQAFRDGQSQARAFSHALGGGAGLVEAFENGLLLFSGDSDSRIAHHDAHRSLHHRRFDPDASARWRELDGIAEQVVEDLLEAQAIGQ